MKVVHETEDPCPPISAGLSKTRPDAGALATVCGIVVDSGVRELALLLGEPAGLEGAVGQEEEGENGDEDGDGSLDDEEPALEKVSQLLFKKPPPLV